MHQENVCRSGETAEEKTAFSVSAFCQLSLAQKILMLKECMVYFGVADLYNLLRVK